MHKKVLIISTSPRRGGNSDSLADAFAQGAREAGHAVEQISLSDKTIGFCKGCLVCQKTQRCVIRDDADSIAQNMLTADVLVLFAPKEGLSLKNQVALPLYDIRIQTALSGLSLPPAQEEKLPEGCSRPQLLSALLSAGAIRPAQIEIGGGENKVPAAALDIPKISIYNTTL